MRARDELDGAVAAVDRIERDPRRGDLPALYRPIRLVLVPWRRMGRAGLLHEELVVEEIRRRRAHQARGDGRSRRGERGSAELAVVLPHEHVAEEFPGSAAFSEVRGMRARRGEVALDRRTQALDPGRIERLAQADDAVAVVGGNVAVRDQAFCRTWTARLATRSLFLAP